MAHFLEDSHRSNELLVVYTWVPFAWFAWPTLVVGSLGATLGDSSGVVSFRIVGL